MHWVVQENIKDELRFENFVENIKRLGNTLDLVKVVPFVGDIIPDMNVEGKVICFGSYSMRHLAAKKGWSPGVYDIEWFPYTSLISALGEDVLNHDAVFGKFKNIVPPSDYFFMRPVHDGKEFAGTLKSKQEFEEWRERVVVLGKSDNGATITGETDVMCSPVKEIYSEYRFFVVGGRVVTGSLYKLGRKVIYREEIDLCETAQIFVDRLKPHIDQPYVIDLAVIENYACKVIEINTLNCAGFYACDVQKLIAALMEYENGNL